MTARNIRAIERVAVEFDATLCWHTGSQAHRGFSLTMLDGVIIQSHLSHGQRNDPRKILSWARQDIRRAWKKAKANGPL